MNEPSPPSRQERPTAKLYAAGSILAVLILPLMAFAPPAHRFQAVLGLAQ